MTYIKTFNAPLNELEKTYFAFFLKLISYPRENVDDPFTYVCIIN